MKFNGSELYPWADFQRIMQQARTLTVKVDGKEYGGEFDLSVDEEQNVVMEFGGEVKKVRGHAAT